MKVKFKRHSSRIGLHLRGQGCHRRRATLWTYKMFFGDTPIGFVECFEHAVHRYGGAGRKHITRTYYPLEWRWYPLDKVYSTHRVGWRRRKDASEDLLQAYDEAQRS
jgi:hypothetical protein